MYAVIFRARIGHLDEDYNRMASQLRQRALDEYGCLEFSAVCEGDQEIAISYWSDLEQIKRWKQDALHLQAQQLGRDKWYRSFRVQVLELKRGYHFPDD